MNRWSTQPVRAGAVALVVWGAAVASAGSAPPADKVATPNCVRSSYDKFKDRTTVQLKDQYAYKDAGFMAATFTGQISAFFFCRGDTVVAPDSVTFEIVNGAPVIQHSGKEDEVSWTFRVEDDHALDVIVDGGRMTLGSMTYARGEQAVGVLESRGLQAPYSGALMRTNPEVLLITLPTSEIVHLFGASATEGKVDDFKFFLQNNRGHAADHYREFANFVKRLQSDSSSQTPSK